jgi:hypothetical protein
MRTSVADLVPILVLSGAFAPTPVQAKEAELAVREALAARLGVTTTDVELSALGLPAPTDLDWTVELPRYGSLTGRVSLSLSATHEGRPVRHRVSPEVSAWLSVPVAAADAAPGTPLALVVTRVKSDTLGTEKPVDVSLAWEAATTLREGQPVTTLRARPLPARREGETVTLLARRGAVTVRADGRLESDAFPGKPVRVVNLSTKTLLVGTYNDGVVVLGGP